jgi:hypothetical protein
MAAGCIPKAPPTPTYIVYGDSVVVQAAPYLRQRIPNVTIGAFGGTAICDWFGNMFDRGRHAPRVVVISFVGIYGRPCQVGATRYDAYRRDLQVARSLFPPSTRVYAVIPPASKSPVPPNADVVQAVLDSGLPTLDARTALGGEAAPYVYDGTHLTDPGCRIYASVLGSGA